jgi:hypothetical protein
MHWKFSMDGMPEYISLLNSVNWDHIFSLNDVNLAVESFYNILSELNNTCFVKTPTVIPRYCYPVWFQKSTIEKIKIKSKVHSLWKLTKDIIDYKKYSDLRKEVKLEIINDRKVFLLKSEKEILLNPKKFWSYIHKLRGHSRFLNKNMTLNNEPISGLHNIADAFAKYFSNVYSDIAPVLDPNAAMKCSSRDSRLVLFKKITEMDVCRAFSKLLPKNSFGPDGIPSLVIKACAPHLIKPLTFIFNLSVSSNVFLEAWKVSRITPLHKSGKVEEISNYRPISVLSSFAKIFELVLFEDTF